VTHRGSQRRPRSLRTGNRRQSRKKHRCAMAAAPVVSKVGHGTIELIWTSPG
jgi:hypothetical protein